MKDTTFIIQGPANGISISNIFNLLKFGKVIISCYDTDNLEKYDIPSEVKIIRNPFPTGHLFLDPAINRQNAFLHAYTTFSGLNCVDTEFAIKLRADEYFEDFSFFIERMKQFPQKYTTINFIIRKDSIIKFHPCDHIFGASARLLKNAFHILFYKNLTHHVHLSMEPKIFLSFLEAKGIQIQWENSKQLMKENCQIVNLRNMKEFIISVNSGKDYKDPIKFNSSQIDFIESGPEKHINANTIEEL